MVVGFEWRDDKPSTCMKVTGALLTKLTKDYTCTPGYATASNVTMVANCQAKKGNSQYVLFSTAKDCANERKAQLADWDD